MTLTEWAVRYETGTVIIRDSEAQAHRIVREHDRLASRECPSEVLSRTVTFGEWEQL